MVNVKSTMRRPRSCRNENGALSKVNKRINRKLVTWMYQTCDLVKRKKSHNEGHFKTILRLSTTTQQPKLSHNTKTHTAQPMLFIMSHVACRRSLLSLVYKPTLVFAAGSSSATYLPSIYNLRKAATFANTVTTAISAIESSTCKFIK